MFFFCNRGIEEKAFNKSLQQQYNNIGPLMEEVTFLVLKRKTYQCDFSQEAYHLFARNYKEHSYTLSSDDVHSDEGTACRAGDQASWLSTNCEKFRHVFGPNQPAADYAHQDSVCCWVWRNTNCCWRVRCVLLMFCQKCLNSWAYALSGFFFFSGGWSAI